jgi:hypothetical protein
MSPASFSTASSHRVNSLLDKTPTLFQQVFNGFFSHRFDRKNRFFRVKIDIFVESAAYLPADCHHLC